MAQILLCKRLRFSQEEIGHEIFNPHIIIKLIWKPENWLYSGFYKKNHRLLDSVFELGYNFIVESYVSSFYSKMVNVNSPLQIQSEEEILYAQTHAIFTMF